MSISKSPLDERGCAPSLRAETCCSSRRSSCAQGGGSSSALPSAGGGDRVPDGYGHVPPSRLLNAVCLRRTSKQPIGITGLFFCSSCFAAATMLLSRFQLQLCMFAAGEQATDGKVSNTCFVGMFQCCAPGVLIAGCSHTTWRTAGGARTGRRSARRRRGRWRRRRWRLQWLSRR